MLTSRSHIFCELCANARGLSTANGGVRTCPACDTHLINPDDAVLTTLTPSEDYKTSVLSGLSPSIIMECASRGMAFFHYQVTQEITYQEHTARTLTDKYTVLNSQLDNVINDANTEIMSLRDKLSASLSERKTLEQKNTELAEAFREKSRAQQRLQSLYQKLKGRVNAAAVEDAAVHDVESVVQAVAAGRRVDTQPRENLQRPTAAHFSGHNSPTMFVHARQGSGGSGGRPSYTWEGQENVIPTRTPSPRERLSVPTFPDRVQPFPYQRQGFNGRESAAPMQPTPARRPLGGLDPNSVQNTALGGYNANTGMSAGVKMGRPIGGSVHRPTPNRPRNLGHPILGMR